MATSTKGKAATPKAAPKAPAGRGVKRKAAPKAATKATPKPKAQNGSTAAPSAKLQFNKDAASKVNFRGARAAWLEELANWDGKEVTAFCKHVQDNPPSTPKTGKYANKCEPPMGWVRWFVRNGIVTIK